MVGNLQEFTKKGSLVRGGRRRVPWDAARLCSGEYLGVSERTVDKKGVHRI